MAQRKDDYAAQLDVRLAEFVEWAAGRGIYLSAATLKAQLEDLLVNTVAVSLAKVKSVFTVFIDVPCVMGVDVWMCGTVTSIIRVLHVVVPCVPHIHTLHRVPNGCPTRVRVVRPA